PTGGHSDPRRRTDRAPTCRCCNALAFTPALADGADEGGRSVREQRRPGGGPIKIIMSGGVAPPPHPLDRLTRSAGGGGAAVEEARAFGRYVCAHAYTPEAITRAMHGGVRTIEHGNLIDEEAARLMAEKVAFLVANLVTYHVMKERAAQFGMTREMLAKNDLVLEHGYRSLEICRRAGVPVAYGSDLLGQLQNEQCREFLIRSEVMKPLEVIQSATTIAARVLRREGLLGVIAPGAAADLLLVDGNPLDDLGLFQDQGAHLAAIMKAGRFHKGPLG